MSFQAGYEFDDRQTVYSNAVLWCCKNNCRIERLSQHGFRIVRIEDLSEAELMDKKRLERDKFLAETDWRVMRCIENAKLKLPICESHLELLKYRQFLRDFPKQENFWTLPIPSFEEWMKQDVQI